MNRKQLYRHALVSFVEPCAANAAALGVMAGAVGYAGQLLGVQVPIYSSLSSGLPLPSILLCLVLLPLMMAFIGALLGLVTCLLTTLMLELLEHLRDKDASVQPNRPVRASRPSEQHQAKAA